MKISTLILTATLAVFTTAALATPAFAQDAKPATHAKKKKVSKAPKKAKKSLLERVSSTTTSKKTVSDAGKGQRLSRDIVFDGSNVNGQYHSAGEAVAKVEQEKQLNELTGVRKDFRDRLVAEKERLQRGDAVSAQ